MSFVTVINASLVVVCLAVLVQSWRMERRMKAFRETQLHESVSQLDNATAQARIVLGELKKLLATEGLAHATSLSNAEALRDELSVMVGIGNAVAERIVEAAAKTGPASEKEPAKKAATPRKRAAPKADATEEGAKEPAKRAPRRRNTQRRAKTAEGAAKAKPEVKAVEPAVAEKPAGEAPATPHLRAVPSGDFEAKPESAAA